jgi:hypothetical protein
MTTTMRLQALREALVIAVVLATAMAYGLILQHPPLLAPDHVKVEIATLEAQVAELSLDLLAEAPAQDSSAGPRAAAGPHPPQARSR